MTFTPEKWASPPEHSLQLNFSWTIARRYLFAKKSTNAVNLITGIAVFGIAVGTAALILVLSVFNGFESLLAGLFGYFSPDVKIEAAKGKFFPEDSSKIAQIRSLPGVAAASATVEETAFFEYNGSQDFGTLKGVDKYYAAVTHLDSTIREGVFSLERGGEPQAVLGAGMRNKLSANVDDPFSELTVYMPKKEEAGPMEKPFTSLSVRPAGTFAVQQDFDNQYVVSSLGFARELLGSDSILSSIEIRLRPGASVGSVKRQIAAILADPGLTVEDRFEQNEAFLKLMRLEKWLSFAILSLTLLLMAFNMVGALWMLVLDKQKDLSTLRSLGADEGAIRRVFLLEGLLLGGLGLAIGAAVAGVLYFLQKEYGLVRIPEGFLVSSYPIEMRAADFLPIAAVVVGIGLLAAWPAAARAGRVPAYLKEE